MTTVMICSVVATIPAVASANADTWAPSEAGGEAPGAATVAQPPTDASPPPEVAAPSAAAEPGGTIEVPAPAEPTAPAEPAAPITADMLDAEPTESATPRPAAPTAISTPTPPADETEALTPNEAITLAYAPKFRPPANPGKLNVAARLMFANAGAKNAGGGRFGGLAVDVGQSWNRFGYALTGTAYVGRFALQDTGSAEVNALIGGGPTIGLGRLALLGRGFLDLRIGYDVFHAVVNERDAGTVVRPQGGGDVSISPAKNLIPHGPRARLDLGLVALTDGRKFFHGIGVSMGYQALVGSFRGEMPVTHLLTFGLSYWMG